MFDDAQKAIEAKFDQMDGLLPMSDVRIDGAIWLRNIDNAVYSITVRSTGEVRYARSDVITEGIRKMATERGISLGEAIDVFNEMLDNRP